MRPHISLLVPLGTVPLVIPTVLAARVPYPADPLQSPMWTAHARSIFGDDPVRFDTRLRISSPEVAENQRSFPVALDARGIGQVRRMVIFADLNPIPIAIDYRPDAAEPYVATRIKLDQRTPVRGAVQLIDGQWLVAGGWVDAVGGGCSAPPLSRVAGDWADHLGEIRGEAWPAAGNSVSRLRISFRHPMDTGLVANIPAYHIEELAVKSAQGATLGAMEVWASVSENPAITLMPHAAAGEMLTISARDTSGRGYLARVPVARQSPVPALSPR
ncbi:quinoprotein dehydrogenase-associated SoxYZ-like carrier [Sphingobium sp. H39-3-25]|uniref:quinoprotein dehydrogenase-associated SoxYZ-like carrier n=1 Tax=Sphingobium arseniciresistens TaxID=3030834 RepID=UPI0023B9367E|nr:quinoprotein dehydrogenase-associated SoxYZ-like carrier [Sphingobium arseniciresistens]